VPSQEIVFHLIYKLKNKMRILVVCPISISPNTRGATERNIRLCEGLHACGNEVFILHAGKSNHNGVATGFLSFEKILWPSSRVARFLDLNTVPFNPSFWSAMLRCIKQIKPDVIQFEFPYSYSLLLRLLHDLSYFSFLTVVDLHNVQSTLTKETGHFYLFPYVLWLEHLVLRDVDLVLTVSEDDRSYIISKYNIPIEKAIIVPNGVDIHGFSIVDKDQARRCLGFKDDEFIVFFHGSMSSRPNREAAFNIIHTIAPKVRATNENISFLIAGEGSKGLFNHVKARRNGVKLLGFVQDIKTLVAAADICIVPLLRGGGTSLKILEYMASGKPIVTTEVGARGLPIRDGEHAIVVNNLQDFSKAIIDLFERLEYANRLGWLARGLASRYDWKNIGENLHCIYSRLLK